MSAPETTEQRRCPVCGLRTEAARCPDDGTRTVHVGGFARDALSYEPGDVIGDRYRVTGTLGRGGFGAVYAAEHTETGHAVAVKLLTVDPDGVSDDVVRRFYREARMTARLTARETVRVFDVGQTAGGPMFLAMELLRGLSLEQLLRQLAVSGTQMTEAEAIDIAIPILKSLAEAHKAGLVHRDLKPANIMIARVGDDDSIVKVLDFGIARTGDSSLTGQGNALGTPGYMSPEQVRALDLDGRSDLYALGCVLFRCVTGELPFEHSDPFAQAFMHVTKDVPDPQALRDVPLSLGFHTCLMRCLAKEPEGRYSDARALRHALEAVRGGAWAGTPQSAWRYDGLGQDSDPKRPGATESIASWEIVEVRDSGLVDDMPPTLMTPAPTIHGSPAVTAAYVADTADTADSPDASPSPGPVTSWLDAGDSPPIVAGEPQPTSALTELAADRAAPPENRRGGWLIGAAVGLAIGLVGGAWVLLRADGAASVKTASTLAGARARPSARGLPTRQPKPVLPPSTAAADATVARGPADALSSPVPANAAWGSGDAGGGASPTAAAAIGAVGEPQPASGPSSSAAVPRKARAASASAPAKSTPSKRRPRAGDKTVKSKATAPPAVAAKRPVVVAKPPAIPPPVPQAPPKRLIDLDF